jgi:hypothetical protein
MAMKTGLKAPRKAKTRRERFLEYAEKRTHQVLKKLQVLGHCSNSQLYEYTQSDVQKIFKAIAERMRDIEAKFTEQAVEGEFKLSQ